MTVRIKPPGIKDGDWNSVRQAINILSKKLGLTGSPTFTGLNLTSLTASRLIASDASKNLISSDISSWIAGTTNQITVTDDSDGTVTLSLPQNIHTGASPTFKDLTISTPVNIYALNHDSFAGFVAGEHFLQTAITNVSTGLATGLLKVTTGTGALSVVTDNSANWDTAYAHSQLTSGNPHSVTKTEIGLSSVENTALSTWAGSTNIITLGTITTGTWTGTTIAIANGGTGQTTQQDAIDALTNVSAATNEYVLTKDTATGNAIFKAASGSSSLTSSAKAYRSATQSVNDSTWTKVQLNAEEWDNDSEFDSATNYRFTATTAGKYFINCKITFISMNGGDHTNIGLYLNGAQAIYNNFQVHGASNHHTFISYVINLAASDYVELWAHHKYGSARNVGAGGPITYMNITHIQE